MPAAAVSCLFWKACLAPKNRLQLQQEMTLICHRSQVGQACAEWGDEAGSPHFAVTSTSYFDLSMIDCLSRVHSFSVAPQPGGAQEFECTSCCASLETKQAALEREFSALTLIALMTLFRRKEGSEMLLAMRFKCYFFLRSKHWPMTCWHTMHR